MAKVLEALIAKGRRAKRPQEQKEIAFGLADLSTHGKSMKYKEGCQLIAFKMSAVNGPLFTTSYTLYYNYSQLVFRELYRNINLVGK
jgi:hypothetical protein